MPPELGITGALNWDINLFVNQIPRSGQEVVVEKIDRVPGGKGGNVAVAASRILGHGHVALIACIGKDDVGKRQVSILKEEGVDTSAIQVLDDRESGQAYITVDQNGGNVIETHFGANAGLKNEHLMLPSVQSILANLRMLVVIDPPRQVAGKLLAEGRRLKRSVMWHPGVLTRFGLAEFSDEMGDLDYLILNEHEATSFADEKRLDSSLETLAKVSPKAKILVTLGNKGAAFYSAGKMSKVPSILLDKLGLKVVNTTGSGDAFVGTFAAYKALGVADLEAFRYANMAGALKACHSETRGSPTRKNLEESYRKYFG
ncbi:MAG TPA: PfkB family carbohydrate kinase [Candidatus Dormibacteraeota bacterium]|nr:PfkB family carbohydrate kinase [Candidatus Dormibacteraeota bacterium]